MPVPLNEYRYWGEMSEPVLLELMNKYYKDLVNLNEKDQYSILDWYIPSINTFIEYKARNEDYNDFYIEQPKWNALMEKQNGWYLNSTPKLKLVYWNIPKLNWIPVWEEKLLPDTTEFGKGKLILKKVTRLYPYLCEQFPYHLLYY